MSGELAQGTLMSRTFFGHLVRVSPRVVVAYVCLESRICILLQSTTTFCRATKKLGRWKTVEGGGWLLEGATKANTSSQVKSSTSSTAYSTYFTQPIDLCCTLPVLIKALHTLCRVSRIFHGVLHRKHLYTISADVQILLCSGSPCPEWCGLSSAKLSTTRSHFFHHHYHTSNVCHLNACRLSGLQA